MARDRQSLIRPVLATIVEATQETACFYVRERGKRMCLYRAHAPRTVRSHLEEGTKLPLDKGAARHVLLAFSGKAGTAYDKVLAGNTLVGALGVVGPCAPMTPTACLNARDSLLHNAALLSQKLGAR